LTYHAENTADPMKRKTVSLCLIARNEEATIGMAIKSVLALVDEVVVVDTGSDDNTRIIAEGYGARVLDVAWEDDFAAARNAALAEASCDWILILDADEFLQPVRPVEFQALLNDPGVAGYRLQMNGGNPGAAKGHGARIRLFRNDPSIRYRYPIHEQILSSLQAWAVMGGQIIADCPLTVVHDTDRPDRHLRQRERNLRILGKAIVGYPEEPYFPYLMAGEGLAMLEDEVLPVAGLSGALNHLHTAWTKVRRRERLHLKSLTWLVDLGVKTCAALLAKGQTAEARTVIAEIQDLFPGNPRVILQSAAADIRWLESQVGGDAPGDTGYLFGHVREDLLTLVSTEPAAFLPEVDERVYALYPYRYLGELSLLNGKVSDAVGYFERALNRDPDYSFGWLGMADCSRFAGDRKRALKLYLRTVTEDEQNHQAWLKGCDLMREMGFHDNAESWWTKTVNRFPEHPVVTRREAAEDLQSV